MQIYHDSMILPYPSTWRLDAAPVTDAPFDCPTQSDNEREKERDVSSEMCLKI